jgi:hypothetical protein
VQEGVRVRTGDDIESDDLSAPQREDAGLAVSGRELVLEPLECRGPLLVDVAHRIGSGVHGVTALERVNLVPHAALVRAVRPRGSHVGRHRTVGSLPHLVGGHVTGVFEALGNVAPAPALGTADRDDELGPGREIDARVQHPVLLRTDELLAIEHEHSDSAVVAGQQLRH